MKLNGWLGMFSELISSAAKVDPDGMPSVMRQNYLTLLAHYRESVRNMFTFIDTEDFEIDDFQFPGLEEFRAWLQTLDQEDVLAEDWGWFGCPIWQFLHTLGFEKPTVYRNGEWWPSAQVEYLEGYEMADWAREFVWLCDLFKPRIMTAHDCLALLDNPLYRPAYWADKTRIPIRRIKD